MDTVFAFVFLAMYPNSPSWGDIFEIGHRGHTQPMHRSVHQGYSAGYPTGNSGCCDETPSYGYPWHAMPPQMPKVPPCGYFPVTIPLPPPPACQAQICVQVPADATLKVNGQTVVGNGTTRMLTTPGITPGKDFKYELQVEFKADGGTRVANREVTVLGGTVSHVDFVEPTSVRTVSSK